MKIFASEFGHSYETYSFAYTLYAQREKGDNLALIYEKGFLPYSGSHNMYDIFYMARSVRAKIKEWEPSSENRRVLRKFDNIFVKVSKPVKDVRNDETFFNLCLSYFNLAHGSAIKRERLELILDMGLITRVIEYQKNEVPVAYLLLVEDETFAHYWFSFYKEEYVKTAFGMWLALDYIREIKNNSNKEYFYFGTCYAQKALYKTNVTPLEFWDGKEWIEDIAKLKALCRSDEERHIDNHNDAFKAKLEIF
jgi:arginyl-tRNA--protein-N-Asp/Glu arginylyltransferase